MTLLLEMACSANRTTEQNRKRVKLKVPIGSPARASAKGFLMMCCWYWLKTREVLKNSYHYHFCRTYMDLVGWKINRFHMGNEVPLKFYIITNVNYILPSKGRSITLKNILKLNFFFAEGIILFFTPNKYHTSFNLGFGIPRRKPFFHICYKYVSMMG